MLLKTSAIFALCCAFVLAQESGNNVPIEPAKPTQPSTTSPPTTTSTSTKAPNTTTSSTTTPSTTTSAQPTTTEPVTTLAPPTKGLYVVKDGNNKTCLIATFAVQVKLDLENKTTEFDVPENTSYSGSCSSNETQELVLSWEEQSGKTYMLSLQFEKNDTTKKFMVSQITLMVPQPDSTLNLTDDKPEFTTSISKSYLCDKQQEIKLAEEKTNTTYAVLKISHVQLQAFHTSADDKFLAAEDCSSSSSPDIVPIAVGCALVGLIAIVLIAYLVGRRRSQARGYLSM